MYVLGILVRFMMLVCLKNQPYSATWMSFVAVSFLFHNYVVDCIELFVMLTATGYLLGDKGYPCMNHLIAPYKDNGHLTQAQNNFNTRLHSCWVSVETAFDCLKKRFPQLHHLKLRNIGRMVQVIHVCCILHNLGSSDDFQLFEPSENENCRNSEETDIDVADRPDPEGSDLDVADRSDPEVADKDIAEPQFAIDDLSGMSGRELRDEICRQLAFK